MRSPSEPGAHALKGFGRADSHEHEPQRDCKRPYQSETRYVPAHATRRILRQINEITPRLAIRVPSVDHYGARPADIQRLAAPQSAQDGHMMFSSVATQSVERVEVEDVPKRGDAIGDTDFLPLRVRAAII